MVKIPTEIGSVICISKPNYYGTNVRIQLEKISKDYWKSILSERLYSDTYIKDFEVHTSLWKIEIIWNCNWDEFYAEYCLWRIDNG